MCGNGAATGMGAIIMRRVRRRIPRGLSRARTAFFAAATGAVSPRSAGRRTASEREAGEAQPPTAQREKF